MADNSLQLVDFINTDGIYIPGLVSIRRSKKILASIDRTGTCGRGAEYRHAAY